MKNVTRAAALTVAWTAITVAVASVVGQAIPDESLKRALLRVALFPLMFIVGAIEFIINNMGSHELAEPASAYLSDEMGVVVISISVAAYLCIWFSVAYVAVLQLDRRKMKLGRHD